MANDQAGPPQVPLGPPGTLSEITINGETYMPTPHEVDPSFPADCVWTTWPPNSAFISDPSWYDALGQDPVVQRRVWAISNEQGQIDQFRQLLHERPDRGLDLMFAAALKGRAYIIKFLLEQGVKATANEAEGDDGSLVPLHSAAYQGHLDCVKILMEEGKLSPNIFDDLGGTPLMRACWGKRADIAIYLLEAGADSTIRQLPSGGKPGASAFEFACHSGCIECAELIVAHALSLGTEPKTLVTRMALAAAATSNDVDMLEFALKQGQYPMLTEGGVSNSGIELTEDQKSALQVALEISLRLSATKPLNTLSAYLESHSPSNEPSFHSLEDDTIGSLVEALPSLSATDSPDHLEAVSLIFKLLFTTDSRFTNPATQKSQITDSWRRFLLGRSAQRVGHDETYPLSLFRNQCESPEHSREAYS